MSYHVLPENKKKTAKAHMKQVVDKVKPDLVVVDSMFILPQAINAYPWISVFTSNLNAFIYHEKVPPFGFGKI